MVVTNTGSIIMGNIWKGCTSRVLLLAIVFKSFALGPLLILSVHGLCLDRIADNNFNWRMLAGKHLKRNDEPPFATTAYSGKAIESERIVPKAIPYSFVKRCVLYAPGFNVTWKTIWDIYLYAGYVPEQIFLQHCCLLR